MFLNDSALVYIMLIFYEQINFIQVHVQISQRDSELHEQGIDLMPPPLPLPQVLIHLTAGPCGAETMT